MADCNSTQQNRYIELASSIRNGIAAGTYARGSKLPSEAQLVAETGLSRSTVRHALDVLVDEGLVVKRRGSGAFVADVPQVDEDRIAFSSFTSTAESQGLSAETRTVDTGRMPATGKLASFFGVAPGTQMVKLVRLRYIDGLPLCLESVYLPPAFDALIDHELNGSLYSTLRQEFHRAPARGHKTFEVCFATQNEAFLLDVERGAALMLITDYVYDTEGAPLHISKRIMRTDRAKYTEPIG